MPTSITCLTVFVRPSLSPCHEPQFRLQAPCYLYCLRRVGWNMSLSSSSNSSVRQINVFCSSADFFALKEFMRDDTLKVIQASR